jgi:hypothetical protein
LSIFSIRKDAFLIVSLEKGGKNMHQLFREGMRVERFDGMRGQILGMHELFLIVLWENYQLGEYHLCDDIPPYYFYPIDNEI